MTFLFLNFSDIKGPPKQAQTANVRNLAIRTHLRRSRKSQNDWVKYCIFLPREMLDFCLFLKLVFAFVRFHPSFCLFFLCSSLKLNLVLALSLSVVHTLWCYPILSSKVRASLLFLMVKIRMVEGPNPKESREECDRKSNLFYL